MSEIKYCEDCKLVSPGWLKNYEKARCASPQDSNNLVYRRQAEGLCSSMRRYKDAYCGAEAKWFEPKN